LLALVKNKENNSLASPVSLFLSISYLPSVQNIASKERQRTPSFLNSIHPGYQNRVYSNVPFSPTFLSLEFLFFSELLHIPQATPIAALPNTDDC
jgi:hypothetical protein